MSNDTVMKAEDTEMEEIDVKVPDRIQRSVDTSHASNQVLHDVLREAESVHNVNLMADKANVDEPPSGVPPKHYVLVEFRHEGIGHPVVRDPVKSLIERDDVRLLDVVECSDDHFIIKIRPVESEVSPVTVKRRDIPDEELGWKSERIEFVMGEAWKAIQETEKSISPLNAFGDVLRTFDVPHNVYDFELNDKYDPRTSQLKEDMNEEERSKTERVIGWARNVKNWRDNDGETKW